MFSFRSTYIFICYLRAENHAVKLNNKIKTTIYNTNGILLLIKKNIKIAINLT